MPKRQPEDETKPGKLIGYARVSTAEQSLQMQIDALVKAGVVPDDIYSETISGTHRKRYKLGLAMKSTRRGDTLVVWKMDRIARNLRDLLNKLEQLEDEGVNFMSLTEKIDTGTPGGRLLMHVLGALAQFERDLIVERTRAGVKAHIARGGRHGAERKMTPEAIDRCKKMLRSGDTARKIAETLGVKPQTIYSYFNGPALEKLRGKQ